MIGLYAIIHVPSKRAYVGSSMDINKRFSTHRSMLKNNYHHSKYLQNAWNKYGEKQFQFKQIANCNTHEEAIKLEQAFLDCFYRNNLFNVKSDAFGVGSGKHHPNKGKPLSVEHKLKVSIALKGKGRPHSEETKNKLRLIKMKYFVHTPDGIFNGMQDAANFYNISDVAIKKRCKVKPDWYLSEAKK
jgi:group I intron endonuclease